MSVFEQIFDFRFAKFGFLYKKLFFKILKIFKNLTNFVNLTKKNRKFYKITSIIFVLGLSMTSLIMLRMAILTRSLTSWSRFWWLAVSSLLVLTRVRWFDRLESLHSRLLNSFKLLRARLKHSLTRNCR